MPRSPLRGLVFDVTLVAVNQALLRVAVPESQEVILLTGLPLLLLNVTLRQSFWRTRPGRLGGLNAPRLRRRFAGTQRRLSPTRPAADETFASPHSGPAGLTRFPGDRMVVTFFHPERVASHDMKPVAGTLGGWLATTIERLTKPTGRQSVMANGRAPGDQWDGVLALLEALRAKREGRVVAIVRVGDTSEHDRALVRLLEAEARMIVLTGASPDRLDEVRSRFARPGRVRVEESEDDAMTAARQAVGPGDVLVAVSSRCGVLWDAMRTPLGAVRRSA
jgi:hypothetical protein